MKGTQVDPPSELCTHWREDAAAGVLSSLARKTECRARAGGYFAASHANDTNSNSTMPPEASAARTGSKALLQWMGAREAVRRFRGNGKGMMATPMLEASEVIATVFQSVHFVQVFAAGSRMMEVIGRFATLERIESPLQA